MYGKKCCNGGRWKSRTQLFEMNILLYTAQNKNKISNLLQDAKKFKFRKTYDFLLNERGKKRLIKSHHIMDRQIQKTFVHEEFIPKTEKYIVPNNSASQKGKGTEHAIKAFKKGLSHAYKVCNGSNFYVMTYDFSDYFNSISHDQVLNKCKNDFDDDNFNYILSAYGDIFNNSIGYGIGGEPSQVISIIYPSKLDRMLECNKLVLSSGRYMDDGWIITKTIDDMHIVENDFRNMVSKLNLTINKNHTNIFSMKTDTVVFLKKRTRIIPETGKIIMKVTDKNISSEIRRIKYQKEKYEKGVMPWLPIQQSFFCYCDYIRKYNSNKQLIRIAKLFSEYFNIEWEYVKLLMNNHWIIIPGKNYEVKNMPEEFEL